MGKDAEPGSDRSCRMTPQQSKVLTAFCNAYKYNIVGLLDALLAAEESEEALHALSPELAAADGPKYTMRQCLQERFKARLPVSSRALGEGMELLSLPLDTRDALNRLWRSMRSTVTDNSLVFGV